MSRNFRFVSTWFRAFLIVVFGMCALATFGQEGRKKLSSPAPFYPDMARKMQLSGVVKLEVVVGADGEIKESKVLGGHPILAEAALKAVRDWKYERGGTETKLQVVFEFHPTK